MPPWPGLLHTDPIVEYFVDGHYLKVLQQSRRHSPLTDAVADLIDQQQRGGKKVPWVFGWSRVWAGPSMAFFARFLGVYFKKVWLKNRNPIFGFFFLFWGSSWVQPGSR